MPLKIQKFPNVDILASVATIPIFWWASVFFVFTPIWEAIYGVRTSSDCPHQELTLTHEIIQYSAIMVAVRFLPLSLVGRMVAILSGIPHVTTPLQSIIVSVFTNAGCGQ